MQVYIDGVGMVDIPDDYANMAQMNTTPSFQEGGFYRDPSTGQVFSEQNGKLQWIPDPTTANSMFGSAWNNYQDVNGLADLWNQQGSNQLSPVASSTSPSSMWTGQLYDGSNWGNQTVDLSKGYVDPWQMYHQGVDMGNGKMWFPNPSGEKIGTADAYYRIADAAGLPVAGVTSANDPNKTTQSSLDWIKNNITQGVNYNGQSGFTVNSNAVKDMQANQAIIQDRRDNEKYAAKDGWNIMDTLALAGALYGGYSLLSGAGAGAAAGAGISNAPAMTIEQALAAGDSAIGSMTASATNSLISSVSSLLGPAANLNSVASATGLSQDAVAGTSAGSSLTGTGSTATGGSTVSGMGAGSGITLNPSSLSTASGAMGDAYGTGLTTGATTSSALNSGNLLNSILSGGLTAGTAAPSLEGLGTLAGSAAGGGNLLNAIQSGGLTAGLPGGTDALGNAVLGSSAYSGLGNLGSLLNGSGGTGAGSNITGTNSNGLLQALESGLGLYNQQQQAKDQADLAKWLVENGDPYRQYIKDSVVPFMKGQQQLSTDLQGRGTDIFNTANNLLKTNPLGGDYAKYQGLLGQSYTDPLSVWNSPEMQGLNNIFQNQIERRDAAAGRNSQYGARAVEMENNFLTNALPQYRTGLNAAAATAGSNQLGAYADQLTGLGNLYNTTEGAANNAARNAIPPSNGTSALNDYSNLMANSNALSNSWSSPVSAALNSLFGNTGTSTSNGSGGGNSTTGGNGLLSGAISTIGNNIYNSVSSGLSSLFS